MLLSDRVFENDCWLVSLPWHDNAHVFMRICDATASLKSGQNKFVIDCSVYSRSIMVLKLCLTTGG